eukprot:gb/GEZN01012353.1/.p1 GENE.gb/GEZN01012353.1/~~gb/GEZN01012353.1/.p1  ORF type:complete len:253 (-),score=58.36 gb/GEZN01012353.1/:193-951(-)
MSNGRDDREDGGRRKKQYKRMGAPLVYDDEKRIEYLSGFRKRKQQRKAIGQEQLVAQAKKDRIERRRAHREALAEAGGESTVAQEFEEARTGSGFLLKDLLQDSRTDTAAVWANKSKYEDEDAVVTVTVQAISDGDDEPNGQAPRQGQSGVSGLNGMSVDDSVDELEEGLTTQALDLFQRLVAGEKVSYTSVSTPAKEKPSAKKTGKVKARRHKPYIKSKAKKRKDSGGGKDRGKDSRRGRGGKGGRGGKRR